jgi:all-trans-retinol 13,14-reductase
MLAAVSRHYFAGGSFPVGGSSVIAKTIDKVIEKAGGTILISAEVDEIIIENKKAIGVKMKDGKIFSAKNIISGAGIMTTYHKLIPEKIAVKHQLKQLLQTLKRSVSHACLYIGLNGSPEDLNLPKTNY